MTPNPSHQSTVIHHLEELIRIPSVSHLSNRPVISYAKSVLESHGWTTREQSWQDANGIEKINLIAAPPNQSPDSPEVDLAFVCHTDTVPYAQSWPDALNPIQRDGHLHGCGACDVKGILACLLTAASTASPSQQTRILLTADEEIGCLGAAHLLATNSLRAKRIVIGEPTQLHVARAGKGYCLARITIRGREAHSALPQQGASAIFAAARIITALEALAHRLEQQQNPIFTPPYTTLNIGTIHGGTAKNIIPGHCEFLVEWRPIPTASTTPSTDSIAEAIQSIASHHAALSENVTAEVTILRQQSGFETNQAASLVQTIESLTNRPAISIPFGSEASLLTSIAEEIVVFGPGDMRTAHSDRERVPIEELEIAIGVIKTLMNAENI